MQLPRARTWRPWLVVLLAITLLTGVSLAPRLVTPAAAAAKTVYIPARWTQTGEVPWTANRSRESTNFILLWGEKSGTNPVAAPSPYNFDPANIISQLENLYSFYVNTMQFTPETGLLAQHKIIVIITNTWNRTELNAWATGGSVDGRVGVINLAPGAALPGSWGVAHELAHVFQNYTFLGRSGYGFTDASAGTFWETSAEFMAMQALPTTAAGDLTRWLRSENLYYSSSRHHYGNWMLAQYIKDRDGLAMFNRMWNEARSTEHPLEVYRRITGITQAELNRRLGEYATRTVTYDFGNRSTLMPFINNVYGAGFLNAYNGGNVEAVNAGLGHYRINSRVAPSDYGFNKIKLVPSTDGGLVKVRLKGHAETGATGWTFGLVAVRNGTPRYSPLFTGTDGQIDFQLQTGETDVWLVVTGTPGAVPHYGFLDGYTKARRFPYEFRVSGATPSGFEPGHVKPNPTGGGRWHPNGGGWVAANASVAATAYVGPKAAVMGGTVTGNARIEGLGWVNGGTVGGNAVVKDNALIQGGANLSGSVVVGGDAEIAFACSSGTYLLFNPDRRCDGAGGETDINPAFTAFPSADLAINGATTPPPATDNKARAATASASYTSPWESVNAINDGLEPASSNDTVNPRWGTWPETGQQWAELTWPSATTLNRAQVYLFDDAGGVRTPASWKLQYWTGSAYTDVPGAGGYPVNANTYNTVTFTAVSTTRLRVVMQASGTASVGLLEVRAYSS
ncbi:hypothetical protein FHR83_006115 [Actinoplanes campanulatus]|uniref:F5/8 type C domain-containing protein n=1 Tax=Actinoplanes campanulatus TaxID=113559 RepID=A0A7W5ALE9_9ACTN|nr:DUF6055 domain-containing protein [Actinoplanes campanulatus]MBB3098416.1 hypothetical protein [Actinoplanes campanulatus]GGN35127.1 hypothetical protein GCM10010109_58850 [Actinoplanes campanulatus]GID39109.1 hypothetical protein Aca09nite_56150 [Actinoplanes campanulatus]